MYVARSGLQPNGSGPKEAERRFNAMNKLHNVLVSHAKKLLNRLDNDHGCQGMLEEYRALKKKKVRDSADDARMEALGDAMDASPRGDRADGGRPGIACQSMAGTPCEAHSLPSGTGRGRPGLAGHRLPG